MTDELYDHTLRTLTRVFGEDRAYDLLDVIAKDPVEVEIRADGTVLWVHYKGVTILRICQISNLILNDHREDVPGLEGRTPREISS